jgi:hypothetical protein
MTRIALAVLAGAVLLVSTATAQAAKTSRCNTAHGQDLAHNAVVKVYKKRSGRTFRYYGCARPRGPVVALTQPFTGNRVKLVASAGAYVAFTRTIRGSGTIAVVDARTGRKRLGLYPPGGIEFDIDPATPQIGAARVNVRGELVVAYVGLGEGGTTDSTIHLYAFDSRGHQQLLDRGPSSKLLMRSIRLKGEDVRWTHDGVTRTAKIGSVPLVVTSGSGLGSGTVTTTPDVGIVCRIAPEGANGICIGSFDPGAMSLVTATAPAGTPVTISGGCTATHVPVLGESASIAQCAVPMVAPQGVRVTFG